MLLLLLLYFQILNDTMTPQKVPKAVPFFSIFWNSPLAERELFKNEKVKLLILLCAVYWLAFEVYEWGFRWS